MLPQENLGPVYDKALEGLGSWMPIELVRRCSKCGEVKGIEGYHPCKSNRDGRQGTCKDCWRIKTKENKRIHRLEKKVLALKDPLVMAAKEEEERNRAAGLKKCKNCGEIKGLGEFDSCKGNLDGKSGKCSECLRRQRKEYHQIPSVKARVSAWAKEYYRKPEVQARQEAYMEEYRQTPEAKARRKELDQRPEAKDRDRDREYDQRPAVKARVRERNQIPEVKARTNARARERKARDLNVKVAINLRSRMNRAIKEGWKNGSAVKDLGCSIEEFRIYLEAHFNPGMTWDNWGKGPGKWHLDHIIPLSVFDLTNREQFLTAAHYTNYQPLWSEENLSKGDKF